MLQYILVSLSPLFCQFESIIFALDQFFYRKFQNPTWRVQLKWWTRKQPVYFHTQSKPFKVFNKKKAENVHVKNKTNVGGINF